MSEKQSVGWALVSGDEGPPHPDTVSRTQRAAMVNALVAIYGRNVYPWHTDEQIKRDFERHKTYGHSIVAVTITRIPTPPGETI